MQFIGIIKAILKGLKKDSFKQSVGFVLDEYIEATAKLKENSSCINKKISDYITEKKIAGRKIRRISL